MKDRKNAVLSRSLSFFGLKIGSLGEKNYIPSLLEGFWAKNNPSFGQKLKIKEVSLIGKNFAPTYVL